MTWEEAKKSLDKETYCKLLKQQEEYVEDCGSNNCEYCGTGNKGVIIDCKSEGKPWYVLMHYGLWSNGRCNYCGEYTNE